jgi:hypothetical protein
VIRGAGWNAGDPYESAPLHLDQLLAPRLSLAGSADVAGFSCTTTFPGWSRAAPLQATVYTYPGNGTAIAANETAREAPFTPGDLVGIGQPVRTGPYLLVFADAPGATPLNDPAGLSDATLTGPTGPVAVRTVDGYTPLAGGAGRRLYRYISPGGFIIPVAPLLPGVSYQAHVVVAFAGQQLIRDWSFTAVAVSPASRLTISGTELAFRSSSPADIELAFTGSRGVNAPVVSLSPSGSLRPQLTPGLWRVCGRQPPTAGFGGFTQCLALVVAGAPALSLGPPNTSRTSVIFPLRFGPALRGRAARLTVTKLSTHCGSVGCRTTSGPSTTRTISLNTGSLRFPLPGYGQGLRVSLQTAGFSWRGVRWTPAVTQGSFVRR